MYKNLKAGKAGVTSLAFNSQDYLVSASLDNTITVWNLRNLEQTKKLSSHIDQITQILFSPSNPFICVSASNDNTITLWNDIRKDDYTILSGHYSSVSCVTFSSTGDYLYSGDQDGKLLFWKLSPKPENALLAQEQYRITSIKVSNDSTLLMYGLANGQLKFMNLIKNNVFCVFDGPRNDVSINCLALHPEQIVMAAGYSDGYIRIFDLTNREVMFEYKAHQGKVNSLVFQPLKRYLVSVGDDALIQVRDLKVGKIEFSLQAHSNKILTVDFHIDSNTFATGDLDGNIAIWKFKEDKADTQALATDQKAENFTPKENYGISETVQSKTTTIETIISRIMDSLDIMHRMADQNTKQLKYVQDYVDLQKSNLNNQY